jgi:hypothetical protein
VSLETAKNGLWRKNNNDQPGCATEKWRENDSSRANTEISPGFSAASSVVPKSGTKNVGL